MDSNEVSKARNESRRISGNSQIDYKLTLLGKHVEKLEKDILQTRSCFDYVLGEINESNNKILSEIAWNQKRMELLKEISDKNAVFIDKRETCLKDIVSLYELNYNVENIVFNVENEEIYKSTLKTLE